MLILNITDSEKLRGSLNIFQVENMLAIFQNFKMVTLAQYQAIGQDIVHNHVIFLRQIYMIG